MPTFHWAIVAVVQLLMWAAVAFGYLRIRPFVTLRRVRAVLVGLYAVVLGYLITVYGFGTYHLYRWNPTPLDLAPLVAATAAVGCALLGAVALVEKFFSSRKKEEADNTPAEQSKLTIADIAGRVILAVVGVLLVAVAALCVIVPTWFASYYGHITGDQLVFTVTSGAGDATPEVDAQVANLMIIPVIVTGLLGLGAGVWPRRIASRVITVVLLIALAGASVAYAFWRLPLSEVATSTFEKSDFIPEHYKEPIGRVTFPAKKRNLIHIYMESVENSYYDKAHGGYDERNLMPDLMALEATGVHFSPHGEGIYGGPHQTFGAAHSIAGMVNMEAGMPMGSFLNDPETDRETYANYTTIGTLLEREGYQNEIMLGAAAYWGSLDLWYHTHGNFKVFDLIYAREHGLVSPDYHVWWGYEDDKLYEFAKDELTRLSQEGKPFYFILENADTHFPDGYVSPNMKDKPFEEQYANVIFYSQAEVARFVRWCQEQPWYENTTIVITGDHQSMDKTFFEGWDPSYERTIVNMYLNPAVQPADPSYMWNRNFAPFDLFPTTLASIGATIEDERVGLGTNLFSGKPTLVEEYGLDLVNVELSKQVDRDIKAHDDAQAAAAATPAPAPDSEE